MLNEFDVIRDVTRRAHKRRDSLYVDGFTRDELLQSAADDSGRRVCSRSQTGDVDKIIAGFALDYYVERSAVSRAISLKRSFNLIPNEAFIKVDCIIQKSSEYRRLEFSRRLQAEQGAPVWIVSKDDLIISKLCWARESHSELQLCDVRNLLASIYDVEYLEHWTRKLELTALLQECLE